MQPTTKLTLTLEWFLNPDHLPFIAGVTTGAYEQAGLDITIIEPDDHYDGFAELQNQSIDLHVNEPIHLFEHYVPNLRALGCFFELDDLDDISEEALYENMLEEFPMWLKEAKQLGIVTSL